jgi:hypothetical protein
MIRNRESKYGEVLMYYISVWNPVSLFTMQQNCNSHCVSRFRFKWVHLSERLAYEAAVKQQRMRTEISQVTDSL